MKIIDKIKTFLLGNKKGNDVIIPSETINYNDYDNINRNINRLPQQPLYTFYRIGPSYITFTYPIDSDCTQEIINPFAIIGPYKYEHDAYFLQLIEDWDNDKLRDSYSPLLEQLQADLKLLATKYNIFSAYTMLGSIAPTVDEQIAYFKKAAEKGVKQGMVAYGIMLLTRGKTESARTWIEKGAELGDETGMMDMAISYQYGTFTPIDNDKAVYFYKRLIQEHHNAFAYNNLGVMYLMANYFHTALNLFEQANAVIEQDEDQADTFERFGERDMHQNAESCRQLLRLPIEERIKRAVEQYHSPKLDAIFCHNQTAPSPMVPEHIARPTRWIPKNDDELIVMVDRQEHQYHDIQALVPTSIEVKYPHDDFVFPTYNVKIRDNRIFGSQYELIFLEKKVHYELNLYIQKHLGQLRGAFHNKGYNFIYLPAHSTSHEDIISSYNNDNYYRNQIFNLWMQRNEKSEYNYWQAIFSEEQLPDDCAGFLHYKPNVENKDERYDYEYILFPFTAGTDWEKAFSYFLQYVGTLPIVKMQSKRSLPQDTMLLVDNEYNLSLIDSTGNKLTDNITMPILSKVLYFTLLRHTDGISIKYLSDYKEELQQWYNILSNRKDTKGSIERLIDPTNNSANEKLSRIRKAFEEALQNYENAPDDFIPTGKKSQPYAISLDRTRIIWQPTQINIFEYKP